jgi:hypothetical protein
LPLIIREFNNVLESTGYHWLLSQMISRNGTFTNVHDTVYVGSYYYFSFIGSKWIEKRDSNLQLVERFAVADVALIKNDVALATDGTYIYASFVYDTAGDGTADGVRSIKITPNGWKTEATHSVTGATLTVGGICSDGTNTFVAIKHASAGVIHRLNSSMVSQASQAENDMLDVTCDFDTTIATGNVYILKVAEVFQRQKDDLAVDLFTNSTKAAQIRIFFQDNPTTDYVYTTSTTGTGNVYRYAAADVSGTVAASTAVDNPHAFLVQAGDDTNLRIISTDFGTAEHWTDTGQGTTIFPKFVSINVKDATASGQLPVGTHFYKISVEDMDEQLYTLSDPIVQTLTATKKISLRIICHDDNNNDYYRLKRINIFRAYNSDQDAESPATDYRFLEELDMNSARWISDVNDHELYYYDYTDNTDEDTISDVTFLEMSGIGDAVKPRFVNGKYFTWLDNQLHLANFSHDGDTFTNRIVRSATNQPDAVSFYDYYNFDVSEGDVINGITNLFGRSVVFKNRKTANFYDGVQEREFVEGLSGENGYFAKDDAIFYISDKGLHIFDGNQVHNLTPNVQTYFDLDTDLDTVSVFYFDNKDRIVYSIHSATNQRTFVLNLKHKTWTYYDLAFKGFLKNNANEYIAWRKTGGATTDYLCELFDGSTKDLEDVGGGNGTAISIEYQSPLLRFSEEAGRITDLLSYWLRFLARNNSLSLKLYKYKDDGKTLVDTYSLSSPTGTEVAAVTHYLNSEWGESYSYTIDGTTPTTPASQSAEFNFHEITFRYKRRGMWDNV